MFLTLLLLLESKSKVCLPADFSDAPIKNHLKNVYATLALAVLSGAAGSYAHLATGLAHYGGGLVCSLLGLGLAMGLYVTPDDGKNRGSRLAMMLGFAFLNGMGLGPLLDYVVRIDPAVIVNAFILSAAIFASFSGVALYAHEGRYLYLGGTLFSGLSALLWMTFVNIFFRSQMLFQVSPGYSLFRVHEERIRSVFHIL